jgi:hypothetical protein
MITAETALEIAYAYREIETAEKLLAEITNEFTKRLKDPPDIRDAFGRRQEGLQLGVPSGSNGHRLYNVPWSLAKPVIEAHIANQKAIVAALCEKARTELEAQ